MDLNTPLTYVKGVGPNRAAMLEAKGLNTVEDLLYYLPKRYEDRTNLKRIGELAPGEMASLVAEVVSATAQQFRRRTTGLFRAVLRDGSGERLSVTWFNAPWLADKIRPGMRLALFGKVEFEARSSLLAMTGPEFEILQGEEDDGDSSLHIGRLVPVYEAATKITAKQFRQIFRSVLDRLPPLPEVLPPAVRERQQLPSMESAIRTVHAPGEDQDLRLLNSSRSPAHLRLIFEEFFWLECGLALKRNKARQQTGIQFQLNDRVREKVKLMLPFKPTGAQKRVLGEIARDMSEPHPMNRLLQGDVGSGKTLVAAEAAVIAIENGYQVALLAPTEVLATQQHLYFKNLFARTGYVVVPLVGSQTGREKQQIKKLIAAGYANVVVGTHALLEADVEFHKLGLAIVDEQHRFGVLQRLKLFEKGVHPDVLVMTATPIPRTLALTIYGDLDTSIIDELPPGRKPIETRHVMEDRVDQIWSFVKQQIDAGRQAYVVYPVIEESETQAMKAATASHKHLSEVVFPKFKVGLLHGKMSADEKDAAMQAFKKGETQILVSTTVIEVGVDVPNASVMVIEQAERFGLSQLHQLRGRVGRGAAQSYCILVTGALGDTARERIRTMVESNDGFYIADMDMRLRGPGEFFGTRQSGIPGLQIASILRDIEVLEKARDEAIQFVNRPPSEAALRSAVQYIQGHWQRRYGLVTVG
jgi:ATP-dependent DNA helicase RecG